MTKHRSFRVTFLVPLRNTWLTVLYIQSMKISLQGKVLKDFVGKKVYGRRPSECHNETRGPMVL